MVSTGLALLLAAAAHAGPALPSFEASLGQLRQDVLAVRATQIKDNNDALARDIYTLSSETRSLYWETSRLRRQTNDLRWRCQRAAPNDRFLQSDVQRFIWDLRDFSRRFWQSANEGQRLLRAAVKDPILVSPAQNLEQSAVDLSSEARWLENDARFASWDFRRAGFASESWDLERESSDAAGYARDLEASARALSAKVR